MLGMRCATRTLCGRRSWPVVNCGGLCMGQLDKLGISKMEIQFFSVLHANQFWQKCWPLYRKLQKCQNWSTTHVSERRDWISILPNCRARVTPDLKFFFSTILQISPFSLGLANMSGFPWPVVCLLTKMSSSSPTQMLEVLLQKELNSTINFQVPTPMWNFVDSHGFTQFLISTSLTTEKHNKSHHSITWRTWVAIYIHTERPWPFEHQTTIFPTTKIYFEIPSPNLVFKLKSKNSFTCTNFFLLVQLQRMFLHGGVQLVQLPWWPK